MPEQTNVIDLNTEMGALTVIIDGTAVNGKESELKERVADIYSNTQEYLYFSDVDVSAKDIMVKIRNLHANMDIIIPDEERMLFFYYLPLKQLTKEWLELYFARIEYLAKQFRIADGTQHQHVCCFTYEGIDPFSDIKELESAVELLQEIACRQLKDTVYRENYLLYTSGVTTLDTQEGAMIQLLHLMSRKHYFSQLGFDADSSSYIKIVNQTTYFEGQAISLDNRIDEIITWQTKEYDKDYAHIAAEIRETLHPLLVRMEKEQNEFQDRIALYPVNIRNYKKQFLKGYVCTLYDKEQHPIVKRRKEAFFAEKEEEIVKDFIPEKIVRFAKKTFYYSDLCRLGRLKEANKESWESEEKTLRDLVYSNISLDKKSPDVTKFAEQLYEKIETELEDCYEYAVRKYTEIDVEKKRCMKLKKQAGKFRDLSHCCEKIVLETKYTIPTSYHPENGTKLIVLISGDLRSQLTSQSRYIVGCGTAYAYENIAPAEVVCLKIGGYINLTKKESSAKKLKDILE